ncbi:MAG: alpha/beta fold hydrolase, partial [Bacteroidales bacterium]|nr:alpha/beta fold hydrolase [Bacteroidales bacterium]
MKNTLIFIVSLIMILITACHQEKILFYPEKLSADYKFVFNNKFEEMFINVGENVRINALLFSCDSSKGLVFYLHGNAGSLKSWGELAGVYLQNNYDFFVLDYRGFGKSSGEIENETQIYNDIEIVYDSISKLYSEEKIVIIGYSIGTCPAARLASVNKPKLLILQAPYYSMPDLARHYFWVVPSFVVKYKLRTYEYIQKIKCPVVIFHGDKDDVIYYKSSVKLQKYFKPVDRLIKLEGQNHNGINY